MRHNDLRNLHLYFLQRAKEIKSEDVMDLMRGLVYCEVAEEFLSRAHAAELQYLADKAEHESHQFDGYNENEI